jgi:hypothetical protein
MVSKAGLTPTQEEKNCQESRSFSYPTSGMAAPQTPAPAVTHDFPQG